MKTILSVLLIALYSQFAFAQKVDVYQRPVQTERSRDFDAIHYRISLNVDLEKKTLSGENRITMKPLNDNLDHCILDAEYLVVNNVVAADGSDLKFDQKDNQVSIGFKKSYGHNDTIIFTVKYILEKANLGLRFIDESPTNPRLVSSDCFPNKARQWIPCYDYPNDKVTTEMIVTVDEKYKVLSNGRLIEVSDQTKPFSVIPAEAGTPNPIPNTPNPIPVFKTWHWSQELPMSTYLINLSIGDYEVIKDSLGAIPINYWVYHWNADDARNAFRKTPQMMSFFNKLFGYDYPWAKYDQVITPYMGGGAEATTATLLGEGTVMDRNAEQDYSLERVIAHELAHQWWGDLITLRSWDQTWLNESFGTYSDYLYTCHEFGEDAGAYDLLGKKNQYLNEAHNRYIRPIVFNRYNDPGDNFDSHTYPKGANVLHLLRHILGDDTFFRTVSTFLHKYAFQPVDTHDLMKTVKEVSGKNMDWFFEQFIFSPGHAIFEVSKSWDEARNVLKVTIVQKQDSLPGVPVYTIPVDLGFHFADQKIVRQVWLKKKVENFEFALPSNPLLVRFDEGNFLLKEVTFKKTLTELVYQTENDDMIGRLSAVDELKEFIGDPAASESWLKKVSNDSFWAVRQAALVNLAKLPGDKYLALIKKAVKDENSKVRQSAVRILGDRKDPSLVKLFKSVFESDSSYAVQSEALRSIGKCGGKAQEAYLKSAAAKKSYRNVVEKAANEALSQLR